MALFHVPGVQLKAISACVPLNYENNREYEFLTEQEINLLIKTTGIEQRRVAEKGVTTSDLCCTAATQLIEKLNIDPQEIGILVFVSQSVDFILPSTAHIIQARLKLPKNCMCLDINLGCSGYAYGLSVVSSLMSHGTIKKGLLMVGDISTVSPNKKDKSTYPLFGDAGTVSLLEADANSEGFSFNLCSDGTDYDSIIIPDGGLRNPLNETSFEEVEIEKGIIRHRRNLALNGVKVFDFAMREVLPNINELLSYNNTTINQYDYLILHQANKLINDTVGRLLKFSPEKMPSSLKYFGNTSSASIPLTMITALPNKLSQKKTFLLCGFGVGLSWGSVSFSSEDLICLPLLEI
ncbi:MAG: ketoacyl-ACP synthase [Cytophagaceae bacterium]|jgi:3-oxoacyl-[acyl-carrier-protein] synthase-3|nr:ketoacyl-ACP synthase [Cytophagaceae bacterium]